MTVALTFAIVQNGMPMKFVDLISYYHIPYVSEKGIAIWKINSEIREEENIPGIDSHAILFVVGGSMEISVQGKIQSLTRGYFVDVLGDKQSVKLLSASPDIQAISCCLQTSISWNFSRTGRLCHCPMQWISCRIRCI